MNETSWLRLFASSSASKVIQVCLLIASRVAAIPARVALLLGLGATRPLPGEMTRMIVLAVVDFAAAAAFEEAGPVVFRVAVPIFEITVRWKSDMPTSISTIRATMPMCHSFVNHTRFDAIENFSSAWFDITPEITRGRRRCRCWC